MMWIVIAVAIVSIVAGLASGPAHPYGDVFAGVLAFTAVWLCFGVVILMWAGYCTLSGQPFVWIWL